MSRFKRHRDFALGFAATFAAVLGLPSAVLGILGAHFSARLTGGLVLAAAAVSLWTNRLRLSQVHLPVDEILVETVDRREPKRLRCPCDYELVLQVGKLARKFYGPSTISVDRYEQLRMKNPYILICLLGSQSELLGYFDVIPLSSAFGEMFLRGRAEEQDITHPDVLDTAEMSECSHLYISGIAVSEPESHVGKEHASILLWGLMRYLDHYFSRAEPIAFASAVTREGEALLQGFGLTLASEATLRSDKHPMYSIQLTHDEIQKRAACIPDYAQLCVMDWESSDSFSAPHKQMMPHRGKVASTRARHLMFPTNRLKQTGS